MRYSIGTASRCGSQQTDEALPLPPHRHVQRSLQRRHTLSACEAPALSRLRRMLTPVSILVGLSYPPAGPSRALTDAHAVAPAGHVRCARLRRAGRGAVGGAGQRRAERGARERKRRRGRVGAHHGGAYAHAVVAPRIDVAVCSQNRPTRGSTSWKSSRSGMSRRWMTGTTTSTLCWSL